VSGAGWTLMVPPGWDARPEQDGPTLANYENQPQRGWFFVVREPFQGDRQAYVREAVDGLRGPDSVISPRADVMLAGVGFTHLHAVSRTRSLWLWLTQRDELGIGFVCGGRPDDLGNDLDCLAMAKTFRVR
jgi:hypothetical protein